MSDEAIEAYRRVLENDPENVAARRHLARLLSAQGYSRQERGELDSAIEDYEEALALDPAQPLACNNLGNAYRSAGRMEQALAAYRDAIELEPGLAEAHLNLGIALQQRGEHAAAAERYRDAIRLRSGLANASLNLGVLLERTGDAGGAAQCYRDAIAASPECAEAHFNLGLQLLLGGNFEAGWEEFEWRFRMPELAPFWPYRGRPRWDGSRLDGGTILLYAEQGLGDAIQFVRFAPMVASRCARVILVCAPALKPLLEGSPGLSVVVAASDAAPEFDACCSLLSLPRILGMTLPTLPAGVPYLTVDPERVRRWKARLAPDEDTMKVGLVWATQSTNRTAQERTLALDLFAPLAGIAGVTYFSLQKGPAGAQGARPPAGMVLRDCASELHDFAETAALLSRLDLLISIDTAAAHLAGALGRPVWTLANWPPEWRWLLAREDSPWYPTMRLFRRQRDEAWGEVISRVALVLRQNMARGPVTGQLPKLGSA